ncbi:MAG: hypothetical protein A3A96_00220 [Candidatus Zambryskibacteria bacterium RIFCSPLOWO2_01_FULL_39_39]|uniref:Peptidase S8/S53 domain-containing protein n=1 Tax=Candidatus Zambryskibacteria bacterium RIFCSPLOWO2_01_FULL_39_39 TaxID=1802758 RepID=A0A1G2TXF3_9BACT|nr:MAG: hypothetical protein A3A96_00220 [Candidatus Zambryskibacteria bacterium RIFCSPLOWO2_01_FULL_39_39]
MITFLLFVSSVFGQKARFLVLFDEKSYETVKKVGRESFVSRPERNFLCPGASHFEWLAENDKGKNGVERIAVVTASANDMTPCGDMKVRRLSEGQLRAPVLAETDLGLDPQSGNQQNEFKQIRFNPEEAGRSRVAEGKIGLVLLDSGVGPHQDVDRFDSLVKNTPDIQGHGTAVVGIAAATSMNPFGIKGISMQAPIISIVVTKFDANGEFYVDQVDALRAILSLHDLPYYELLVVNMSFVILENVEDREKWDVWAQVLDSLKDKALFVAGSGNDSRRYKTENLQPCASSHLSNVICVAGVDRNDSSFGAGSSWGMEVTTSAPWCWYTTLVKDFEGRPYGWRCGTSMATPGVAGALTLAIEERYGEFPNSILTPEILKKLLVRSSRFAPALIGKAVPGILDVGQLLKESRLLIDVPLTEIPLCKIRERDGVLGSWSERASFARGDLASIYGENLEGCKVYLNGKPLEILYSSQGQLNFVFPAEILAFPPKNPSTLAVVREFDGRLRPETTKIILSGFSPSESIGVGGIYREGGLVSPENPARPGDTITVFLSGAVGAKSATVLLGGTTIEVEVKESSGVQTISFTLPDLPAEYGLYGKVQVGQSQADFGFNYTR